MLLPKAPSVVASVAMCLCYYATDIEKTKPNSQPEAGNTNIEVPNPKFMLKVQVQITKIINLKGNQCLSVKSVSGKKK